MENIRVYTDFANNAILLGTVLIIVWPLLIVLTITSNYSDKDVIWYLIGYFGLIVYNLIKSALSISELIVSGEDVKIINKLSDSEEFLVQDISNIKFRRYTLTIYTKRKKYVGYFEKEIGRDVAQKLLNVLTQRN